MGILSQPLGDRGCKMGSCCEMGSEVEDFRIETEILLHATAATSVVLPRIWGDSCQLCFGCA